MKLLYDIPEDVNTLINIYKAKQNLKNKSEALNHLVRKVLSDKKKK